MIFRIMRRKKPGEARRMEFLRKIRSRTVRQWLGRLGALLLAGLLLAGCEGTKAGTNPLEKATQGTALQPLAISLPYDGTVGAGSSYYKVTGLVSGAPNTIDLTGFVVDLDLRVGNDPTFAAAPVCMSASPGSTPETCTVTADGAGVLYVQVVNIGGGVVSFTLSTSGAGLAVPTGLVATPGDGQVSLSWNPVSGATSYNVYRGTAPGVTVTPPPLANVAVPAVSFNDTAVVNGTTYYYIVTAFDGVTESGPSTEDGATPQVAPPAMPTGVGATPGQKQVTVSWTDDPAAASYNIYWSSTPGLGTGGTPIVGAANPYTLLGLTNGTAYYFTVEAVNAGGTSPLSGEVSTAPFAQSILILGENATTMANLQTVLAPFGFFVVDVLDNTVTTATLATLAGYDAVLVFGALKPLAPIVLGDNLADYVDAGGRLVFASYSHTVSWGVEGRITSGGYSPFNFDGTNPNLALALGTVYDPGHPIMLGVVSLPSGSNTNPTLAPGAILLAEWNNATPAVAVEASGTVVVITSYLDQVLSGDWGTLLGNALSFVSSH
jgi:hypothetical protein